MMVSKMLPPRIAEAVRLLCARERSSHVAERMGLGKGTVRNDRQQAVLRTFAESFEEVCRMAESGAVPQAYVKRANALSLPLAPQRPQRQLSKESTWRRYP